MLLGPVSPPGKMGIARQTGSYSSNIEADGPPWGRMISRMLSNAGINGSGVRTDRGSRQ